MSIKNGAILKKLYAFPDFFHASIFRLQFLKSRVLSIYILAFSWYNDAKLHANHTTGTDGSLFFLAYSKKFNLDFVRSDRIEDLLHCLQTGGAAIISVSGDREGYHGVFSDRRTHFIVAAAQERDGRIAVMDPAYEEGAYEQGDRKGKVEVLHRGFCRCSLQATRDETKTRTLPFYLFWRK